jgi:hypothetical protein
MVRKFDSFTQFKYARECCWNLTHSSNEANFEKESRKMNATIASSRMQAVGQNRTIGSNYGIPPGYADKKANESQPSSLHAVKVDPQERIQSALGKLAESMNEFAQGVLGPQSCLVGPKTYETAMSRTRANFRQEQSGFAQGIKEAIRKYATAARESVGPPVKLAETITNFEVDFPPEFIADMLPAAQGIDMLI